MNMKKVLYINKFMEKLDKILEQQTDPKEKQEILNERLKWLDGYQNKLKYILESGYLKPEYAWRLSISHEEEASDPNFHENSPPEIYERGYNIIIKELVSSNNEDRQLDFLRKLKDDVITPMYVYQPVEWTAIEEGVQNRLKEIRVLLKKVDCLRHDIEKQIKLEKKNEPQVEKIGFKKSITVKKIKEFMDLLSDDIKVSKSNVAKTIYRQHSWFKDNGIKKSTISKYLGKVYIYNDDLISLEQ